jgi:acetyltransferase-like isoleucine patch superfamily enzyme
MKAAAEVGWGRMWKFGIMTLAMIPYGGALFPPVRSALLRLYGARIGKGVVLHNARFFNLYRRGLGGLRLGDFVFIGDECLLDLAESVEMEDHVTLAERVMILTHMNVGYRDHPLQKHFPASASPVFLEKGCFIGAQAVILPGVRVGGGSFVAAGSVVTRDIPPHTLAAGTPARVVRALTS